VAADDGQVILLDLERCSVGPPEWDLVSSAVKYVSYGRVVRVSTSGSATPTVPM
jgi:hypothetical protein